MSVGLLRYVDIGDLGDIIKSKLKIGLKSEITHDLWEITKHRNKLSHSQDFPKNDSYEAKPRKWMTNLNQEALQWSDDKWLENLKGTTLKRIKPWMWKRNIKANLRNK